MEENLRTLKTKRGTLKARATRFANFVEGITNENELTQLKIRLTKFEACWQEFEDIQSSIESLDPSDGDAQDAERETFENNYFSAVAAAENCLKRMVPIENAQPAQVTNQATREHTTQVKLPTINLPTFSGAYDQWLPFLDTFTSLIHDDPNMSDVQKFHYLRSALASDAAQVIHSLELSALNYEVAWNLLKERYQNKRLIVQNHVKALFDLPCMAKESHSTLRLLLDTVSRHLRALKTLDQPTESWDTLMIYLITSKFDSLTKREWESIIDSKELPSMDQLTKFLNHRCQLLESLNDVSATKVVSPTVNNTSKPRTHFKGSQHRQQPQSLSYVAASKVTCPKCTQEHFIYQCQEFKGLQVNDRIKEVKRLNLCSNCLRPDHQLSQCRSSNCRLCSRKHNTLLHIASSRERVDATPPTTSSLHVSQTSSIENTVVTPVTGELHVSHTSSGYKPALAQFGTPALLSSQPPSESTVLLSTALIIVYDNKGQPHNCRALLDSGSQSNFVTQELLQRLNLKSFHVNVPVRGINQLSAPVSQNTKAIIQSRLNAFSATLSFLVLDQITDRLPTVQLNRAELRIPNNLTLADPSFDTPQAIDMLLGADIFWELLCVGQIRIHRNLPVLQKTHFGWVVSGRLATEKPKATTRQHCYLTSNSQLQQQLTRFWVQEEPLKPIPQSADDAACETFFLATTTRDSEGRFMVRLPMRSTQQPLGESYPTALKRLYQLERRLDRNPLLKGQYSSFLKDYLQETHMETIHEDMSVNGSDTFYLPHHAVVKEHSTSTKVRVVFDGSARSSTGVALNDLLMVGPTVQQDLFSIITRFRIHKYVITGDIKKMYRQIRIHPDHTNLQRILWREDVAQPVQIFRLNTVTYGTASAPFLATRCLLQLAKEEEHEHPVAAEIISRDFYVDDLLTGADDLNEIHLIKDEVITVLNKGAFEMHKWNSNCPTLKEDSEFSSPNSVSSLTKQDSVKTLGIRWESNHDIITYVTNTTGSVRSLTKRIILSQIAEIFDPLGLLGPVIISAKLLIQQLWQLKIGWDETIPMNLFTRWQQYVVDLQNIDQINIPRHVMSDPPTIQVQLHGFCDASESAYGACIFLRSTNDQGVYVSHLLCAKSRVAPLKTISVPRLELCGALLLAQLAAKVINALSTTTTITEQHFWTDSTIALSWIGSSPHLWKVFVANRVTEIQELTSKGKWHHISSQDNPADILSRGATTSELSQHHLWWHGPPWLVKEESEWITKRTADNQCHVPESRTTVLTCTKAQQSFSLFEKYSSFSRLINVVAFCLRFQKNCLKPTDRLAGSLKPAERQGAITCLVKLAQKEAFSLDLQQLLQSGQLNSRSKLLSLSPFIDEFGIIRVGGRLRHANISPTQRHPILLPSKHRLTELIIMDCHLKQLHAGPQATLATLRLQFWPLSGRQATKRTLRTCIRCFRANPSLQAPKMGDLPANRINPSRPFMVSGVDFCGPLRVRDGGRRSKRTTKGYVAIFVCFSTRAVHIELVGDLTTESFLGALKRFISRRGKCTHLTSDNATNFVGANRELRILKELFATEVHQERVNNFLAEEGIVWDFIPARSPHFGGLWEAGVKSCKHHLRRVVGDAALSFEELSTVLAQIESCLNSRPLTPMSSDPSDLTCLTPGHFLIGDSLSAYGEPSLMSMKQNRLSRWQRVQQLTQHFWSRWAKEYLSQLQARNKWKSPQPPITVGSMIIMREDRIPPLQWPLGRIIATHPGRDGIVRVVTVRTATGVFKRAVTQVCVLPMED